MMQEEAINWFEMERGTKSNKMTWRVQLEEQDAMSEMQCKA